MDKVLSQIDALKTAPAAVLEAQYAALTGKKGMPANRGYLIRQLAYRMQEQALGGMTPEVRDRIQRLIAAYDPVNKTSAKSRRDDAVTQRDSRLPIPGSLISKIYKGQKIDVKVLENGFEYQSVIYKNLSAVAKAITGSHWNGFIFFGFKKP